MAYQQGWFPIGMLDQQGCLSLWLCSCEAWKNPLPQS